MNTVKVEKNILCIYLF